VENQAIARALRIGQEQPVVVTRYIVQDSVEQVGTPLEKKTYTNLNRICKRCKITKERRLTWSMGKVYYAVYVKIYMLPLYTNGTATHYYHMTGDTSILESRLLSHAKDCSAVGGLIPLPRWSHVNFFRVPEPSVSALHLPSCLAD
jgi:hypothetical protein